jgi:hypothetical protein
VAVANSKLHHEPSLRITLTLFDGSKSPSNLKALLPHVYAPRHHAAACKILDMPEKACPTLRGLQAAQLAR